MSRQFDSDNEDDETVVLNSDPAVSSLSFSEPFPHMTEEELRTEEEEIKELERRKQGLEERVSWMEKDLAGVLR